MSEFTPYVELATMIVGFATAVVGLMQARAQRPRRKKKNRRR